MARRLRTLYQTHTDFILILILFAVFRLLMIVALRPGGFVRDYSDYLWYEGAAGLADRGFLPFVHYWLEYPPPFPWLALGVYKLSLLIPPWENTHLWFNLLLGLALLPFEVGNLVLIYRIAGACPVRSEPRSLAPSFVEGAAEWRPRGTPRRSVPDYERLRAAWLYALLFVPAYTLLTEFDTLPLFFLLWGLFWLVRGRARLSGAALGVGAAIKVTPVLLLPVAVRALDGWRQRAGHVVAAALAVLALYAPFLLTRPVWLITTFRSMAGRSTWESVWAVLEGFYGYGEVGGNRLDPAVADFTIPGHPGAHLPWLWITLAFVLVYGWLFTRRVDYRRPAHVVALAGLTVNGFMLYSKGFSPQFTAYLLPFVVLLLPNLRGVGYALLLTALNFAQQPFYHVMFPDQHWLLAAIAFSRAALLVGLCLEYGLILFDRATPGWQRARRGLLAAFVAVFVVGGMVAAFRLAPAYAARRYAAEEYRPMIEFLRQQAGDGREALVFTEQDLHHRFYPFLRGQYTFYLINDHDVNADQRIAALPARHSAVWLVIGPHPDPGVEARLEAALTPLEAREFAGLGWLRRFGVGP